MDRRRVDVPVPPAAGEEVAARAREGLDLFDLIEAMSGHFHEHHNEIVRWPWKVFCVKWARLVRYMADKKREELEKPAYTRRAGGLEWDEDA